MKKLLAITGVMSICSALFFAVVCAGADLNANSHSAALVARPLNGTWSGTDTVVGLCQDGRIHAISVGTGFETISGKTGFALTYCLDPLSGAGAGDGVITAANGDVFVFEASLEVNGLGQPAGTFSETWTILGGTGRFAGATGSGIAQGTWVATSPIPPETNTWVAVTQGEVIF